MLRAFLLIPALRIIFSTEVEFTEDSFAELTVEQYEAYERKVGKPKERVFRMLPMEPTVVERQGRSRITLELSVVSESQRKDLLDAVKFIYSSSREINDKHPTFTDRLDFLRLRFPTEIVGGEP